MQLFLLFLCIALTLAKEEEGEILDYVFYCRLRVSNISEETAEVIRSQDFQPQFELSTHPGAKATFWLGGDVRDEPNQAEVLYKAYLPRDIVGVVYPVIAYCNVP